MPEEMKVWVRLFWLAPEVNEWRITASVKPTALDLEQWLYDNYRTNQFKTILSGGLLMIVFYTDSDAAKFKLLFGDETLNPPDGWYN